MQSPAGTKSFRSMFLMACLPAVLVVALYSQTLNHPFLQFDDAEYIADNPHVNTGLTRENVRWALTTPFGANYHPITTLTWQAEVSLFGIKSGQMLFDNALLHAGNCVLLFLILSNLTGAPRRSLVVCLLFAVHPMRVESVAWVIERKDTLSFFFGLLTVASYAWYARRPGRARYLLVGVLLTLGLLSKSMLVTMPALLLLLDLWPLRRWDKTSHGDRPAYGWRWLVVEKIPLLMLSGLSAYVTIRTQNAAAAVQEGGVFSLSRRLLQVPANYFDYVVRTLSPDPLCIYYTFPPTVPWIKVGLGVALLVGMTVIALLQVRKRPYLISGWAWFLISLTPVIGLIQAGMQSTADRYAYHTTVGLLVILVWSADDVRQRLRQGMRPAFVLVGVVTGICMLLTNRYLKIWADPVTLFQHTAEVSAPNWMAHSQLGLYALMRADFTTAEHELRRSIEVGGESDVAHHNLALVLENLKRYPEAYEEISRVRLSASSPAEPYVIRGRLLIRLERFEEAFTNAVQALRLSPDDSRVHRQLAFLYDRQGDAARAQYHLQRMRELEANPNLGR